VCVRVRVSSVRMISLKMRSPIVQRTDARVIVASPNQAPAMPAMGRTKKVQYRD
jgi:hypothetical protein